MKSLLFSLLIVATFILNLDAQKVSINRSLLAGAEDEPSNGVTITDNILWFNYLNGAFRAGRLTTDAWAPNNSGTGSVAFGYNSIASGNYAMAINQDSKAIGVNSFASGFASEALGTYSVALGLFAKAGSRSSIALGQYNIGLGNPTSNVSTDPILEIGNGINSANRSNAFTILKNGRIGIQTNSPTSKLHLQANSGEDPFAIDIVNETKFKVYANGGISLGPPPVFVNPNNVYIHGSLGIGEPSPSEAIDTRGAIKLGPSQLELSGTIRFQNFKLEGRVRNKWRSLTSDLEYFSADRNINIGYQAGLSDTVSNGADNNVQIGHNAGIKNRLGDDNVFLGNNAGMLSILGSDNTYVGAGAGKNNPGNGNIFIGKNAGENVNGNNLLIIENSNSAFPLIAGNFADRDVTISGALKIDEFTFVGNPFEVSNQNQVFFKIDDMGTVEISERLQFESGSSSYRVEIPNISSSSGSGVAYAWDTYSDQRVKSNVENVKYGLAEVMQLRPVTYKHFDSKFEGQQIVLSETYNHDIGFIAQEVYEIITEIVAKPNDETQALWSMNYEKLTPVLVKAIQEQQAIIENLKREHETIYTNIKSELNALKELIKDSLIK